MSDRLMKVLTRRTSNGQISMWGTLHVSATGATRGGWLCDSWTEAGTSAAHMLQPRVHWLDKKDNKFYVAHINISLGSIAELQIGPLDMEIEPRRESFLRTTLAKWEDEYLLSDGVQVS